MRIILKAVLKALPPVALVALAALAVALAAGPCPAGTAPRPPAAPPARGGPTEQPPARRVDTYVLAVSGMCRDDEELPVQRTAVAGFRTVLLETGEVEPDHLVLLDAQQPSPLPGARPATAEALKAAAADLAARVKTGDRFIFYYRGQANLIANKLRINLDGADINHEALSEMFKAVRDCTALFILDCPNAGFALKSLSGENRIIICGARGDQPYITHFSEYFIPALVDPACDFDKDGAVSLLEAYRHAVVTIDELYEGQNLAKTESALLEDDGDGVPTHRPWEHTEDAYDGAAASRFFLKANTNKEKNDAESR